MLKELRGLRGALKHDDGNKEAANGFVNFVRNAFSPPFESDKLFFQRTFQVVVSAD